MSPAMLPMMTAGKPSWPRTSSPLAAVAAAASRKLVDKVLTNIPWEDRNRPGAELRITRSPVNPTEARNVMNRLILACERQCAPPLNVRSMEGVRQLVQVAPR